jgi:hypothetical protein
MLDDFSIYIFEKLTSSLQLFGVSIKIIEQWYVPCYGG